MTVIETALTRVQKRLTSPAWADEFRVPVHIGLEFDELADDIPLHEWSPLRRNTMAALRTIRPRHKLAVLAIVRDETPHLAEFFAHYRAIGVEHFFIYSNDNSDGTDGLLRWFAGHLPVSLVFQTTAPGVNVQAKAYAHALGFLPELRLYEWVLVVDADEHLLPGAQYGHSLRKLVAAAPADTESISFPWRWRHWAPHFSRQPGLLCEMFTHASAHNASKAVMRLRQVWSLQDVHSPRLEAGLQRDSAMEVISGSTIWDGHTVLSDTGGVIDHYWGKSFEEFVIKKRRSLGVDCVRAYGMYRGISSIAATPYVPVPEAMVAAIKHELARFEARPSYQQVLAEAEARYALVAAEIQGDAELRGIYESIKSSFL
jgi:hypothetical protein